MSDAVLYGWGRTHASHSTTVAPTNDDEVLEVLANAPRVIARGLGRSYGDAAALSGGVVLDNRQLNEIGPIDDAGVVSVGAGVSIDELLKVSVPQGWFVPVTPGTRQVTIGGALAADVHGKNHHVDGSFAAHVRSMRLVTPRGVVTLSRDDDAALFWATMGAMGLTGVVTSVTLSMLKISTDQILVDTDRYSTLDDVMAAMVEGDERYRYSVAWVDCMRRGAHQGRSILTRGSHAEPLDVEHPTLRPPARARLAVPVRAPNALLNTVSIQAFNELWFRHAPRHDVAAAHSLSSFFHPLDGLGDWNLLYGSRGFVQYQFCVPDAASECVGAVVGRLVDSRVASFLAVLKRFGPANPAPLSFPQPGWTLALDLPVGPEKLAGVLDELDELVLEAGGRVYLAKDDRLSEEMARAMYPRLEEFLEIKARVDPRGQLTSDLARRLHLVGT